MIKNTMPDLTGMTYRLHEPPGLLVHHENPAIESVVKRHDTWLRSNLGPIFSSAEELDFHAKQVISRWVCYVFPSISEQAACNLAHYTSMWQLLDDWVAWRTDLHQDATKAQRIGERLQRVIQGEQPNPNEPIEKHFAHAWQQVVAGGAPGPVEVATEKMLGYIDYSFTVETQRHRDYDSMTLEEFTEHSRIHIGVEPWIQIAEVTLGIDLGDELRTSPKMRELWDAVSEATRWVEDISSFRKEYFSGDRGNIVLMLMRNEGYSLQDAIDRTYELYADAEARFVRLRDEMLAGPHGSRPELHTYLHEIGHEASGMWMYGYVSPRYHGRDYVWNGKTSGVLTLWPDRTDFPA
ncbi:terpene synthase family protein [Streptomyces sp. NPDC056716]|uniref:terpene synthase family protein n=1 Tax=unclassified Streptomyces TaxID=2593676 RepID=UPI0036900DBE